MGTTIRKCAVCGEIFTIVRDHGGGLPKYCSKECKKAAQRKKAKERALRRGEASEATWRELAGRPKGPLTVAECARCRSCEYVSKAHAGTIMCDYAFRTGEPRGCDVSEHCERYERKTR